MELGTVVALVVIVLLMAAPAYAYIDPGSGSMLLQLVTGGVAGALVLVRLYWKRLKEKITGKAAAVVPSADHAAPTEPRDRR